MVDRIDLHDLYYDEAIRSVIKKIEIYWGNEIVLEIITGYSNKMKDIVIKLLEEYSLDYKIGGNIGINNGVIRVEMKG